MPGKTEAEVAKAAQAVFDFYHTGRFMIDHSVLSSRELWAELGEALYGADDPRVKELREKPEQQPTHGGVREELKPLKDC